MQPDFKAWGHGGEKKKSGQNFLAIYNLVKVSIELSFLLSINSILLESKIICCKLVENRLKPKISVYFYERTPGTCDFHILLRVYRVAKNFRSTLMLSRYAKISSKMQSFMKNIR